MGKSMHRAEISTPLREAERAYGGERNGERPGTYRYSIERSIAGTFRPG
jgi:hypothetical protein